MNSSTGSYFSFVILIVAVMTGILSCTTEDQRDLCCSKVTLEYRYVRHASDDYPTEVDHMRHFLFDAKGQLIREIPQSKITPQRLSLAGLQPGSYTVLTVGNSTDSHTKLSSPSEVTSLTEMILSLSGKEKEIAVPADQLFWNYKSIDIKIGKRHHYICDLANIHCHLFYKIIWQSVPPYADGYTVRLSGLTKEYTLDPGASDLHLTINPSLGVSHDFPHHGGQFTEMEDQPKLLNHTLEGQFTSLRYRNDRIPTIRLWHGDEPITGPLDLTRAFASFGWIPDERPEQIYRILIRINDDGSITIFPFFDASVTDWIPGGTVIQ